MPQGNGNSNSNGSNNPFQKKKKKGHSPAHQNTFAFRHNPKSKKTAAILESPIDGVCRRCHDKLEWRKRYRKYKPLTQPSKCNLCGQRNVRAAYHTICALCAQSSSKALQFLEEWNQKQQQQIDRQQAHQVEEDDDKDDEKEVVSLETQQQQHDPATRVCAVCVQEPALPENYDCSSTRDQVPSNGGHLEDPAVAATTVRPWKLRELKTLERQRERAAAQPRKQNQRNNRQQQEPHEDNHSSSEEVEDLERLLQQTRIEGLTVNDDSDDDDGSDDANDPFLQAVGGADKLLTGEAYQQKLLLEQEQKQQT